MITYAKNIKEAVRAKGEIRAGGTDLQERFGTGVSQGDIVDITGIQGLDQIQKESDGSFKLGALVKLDELYSHPEFKKAHPGLSAATRDLATPQIRYAASLGGALCQKTRCWYYRNPDFHCFKRGGDHCPARDGNHKFGVCFDYGPCVYPHPSTLGMALMTYEPQMIINGEKSIDIFEFYGDGTDPQRDHQLKHGEMLTHIVLPATVPDEKAAYFRLTGRRWAEWPLVEVFVRIVVEEGKIKFICLAAGAVANIPIRLKHAEEFLQNKEFNPSNIEKASLISTDDANPLPGTVYKIQMMQRSLVECIRMAVK